MTVEVTRKEEMHPTILQCWIGTRYWEDSSFNGEDDDDTGGLLRKLLSEQFFIHHDKIGAEPVEREMRDMEQDFMYLEIDLVNGKVRNWPNDVTAEFHYKSCDINYFRLLDDERRVIAQTPAGDTEYVIGPEFMNEWGDYFVLNVKKDGYIEGWDSEDMQESLQEWIDRLEKD